MVFFLLSFSNPPLRNAMLITIIVYTILSCPLFPLKECYFL